VVGITAAIVATTTGCTAGRSASSVRTTSSTSWSTARGSSSSSALATRRRSSPKGGALALVVEQYVADADEARKTLGVGPVDWSKIDWTEEVQRASWRQELDDPKDGSIYVGGWNHCREYEKAFYNALCVETGVTPDDGSPHFMIHRDGPGYFVDPTIMYWRKANAIHRWFVENVQNDVDDCRPNDCTREQLLELVAACEKVHLDHGLAAEVLPSQAGFFFGGTEYDGWYFEDVKETAINLKAAVEHAPHDATFYYESSW